MQVDVDCTISAVEDCELSCLWIATHHRRPTLTTMDYSLAEDTVFKRVSISEGAEFSIAGKEVSVLERANPDDILSSKTDMSKHIQSDSSILLEGVRKAFKPPTTTQQSRRKLPPSTAPAQVSASFGSISSSSFYTSSSGVRKVGLPNPGRGTIASPLYDSSKDGELVVMNRPDAKHQTMYNKKNLPVVDVHINPVISSKLRPHQVEGIRFLYDSVMEIRKLPDYETPGAILADDMGLGKTLQTIALIEMLLRQSCYYSPTSKTIERALIVCPSSLVKNWKNEFSKWLGNGIKVECVGESTNVLSIVNGRFDVMIVNYDKLRIHVDAIANATPRFGLLVCDEAQKIKSQNSKTTQAFDKLRIDQRILLTGTPIQNNLSEFYTMINFVAPNLLTDPATFKRTFETPILRGRRPNCPEKARKIAQERSIAVSFETAPVDQRLIADLSISQLQKITGPLILRREASILKNLLPPKYEQVVFCCPSPLQVQIYNAMADGDHVKAVLRTCLESGRLPLEGVLVLRKLCNTPDLLIKDVQGKGSSGQQTRTMLGRAKELLPMTETYDVQQSGKLTLMMKMLRRIQKRTDDKVVLVSNFTATLDIVEKICRKWKFSFGRLDGNVKQADRMTVVNSFNRASVQDCFLLLLSSKTGGAGLNLIGANRLILLDNDWNPATDAQAMARIHRDGQLKPCYIYRLLLSGTMDEKIFQRQISKTGLSTALMGKEGSTGKLEGDFAQAELEDIFRFHPDTPCATHELLGCTCGGKGDPSPNSLPDDEDELEDETDEAGLDTGFVKASMVMGQTSHQKAKQNRRKLAALFEWTHHNFAIPDVSEMTEDAIINEIIWSQNKSSAKQSDGNGMIGEDAAPSEQRDVHHDSSEPTFNVKEKGVGSILYVFAKESAKADIVEDEDEDRDKDKDSEGELSFTEEA